MDTIIDGAGTVEYLQDLFSIAAQNSGDADHDRTSFCRCSNTIGSSPERFDENCDKKPVAVLVADKTIANRERAYDMSSHERFTARPSRSVRGGVEKNNTPDPTRIRGECNDLLHH